MFFASFSFHSSFVFNVFSHSSCHCFEIGPVYTCSFFAIFILFYFRRGQNNVVLEMNGSPSICRNYCTMQSHGPPTGVLSLFGMLA